ncbi:MAG TPA: hypothetical protein VMR34_04110 [Candidatus Saccharimonadales bacterium]|nr:hypothetical protein [Candidatus Saccharimonadales bacterium]
MNWFTWQQHKKQFMVFGILFLLVAALAVPTEIYLWHVIQQLISVCGKTNQSSTCFQSKVSTIATVVFGISYHLIQLIVLTVPFLLGLFWGVPLVANEYINGTNKLVWTRSISRKRWLTVKLVWILIAGVIFAGAFAALATWWSRVSNAVYSFDGAGNTTAVHANTAVYAYNRFTRLAFDTQGIVPAAYAVFAITVGIAVGTWFKRIMTALAVTLGVLIVVQVAVPYLVRPNYETPRTASVPILTTDADLSIPPVPNGDGEALIVSGAIVNNQGQAINFGNPPAQCSNALQNGTATQGEDCITQLGYHWSVKYQPAYRYWDFQRIETALYLGLAIIPIAGTYWLVLRRDA